MNGNQSPTDSVRWEMECLGGNLIRPVAYSPDRNRWVINSTEDGDGVGFYDSAFTDGMECVRWTPDLSLSDVVAFLGEVTR